jgi:hypothetical protein
MRRNCSAYVKGRRAGHWRQMFRRGPAPGTPASRPPSLIASSLTFAMALGEGEREVPDSEDEPMTSSPVDKSDDVAHKLCMAAPAPPQDAQDALQKAARPHQETTANVANLANDRTGGLGADQSDASININAPSNATIGIQLDNAAATQCADTTAISKTPNHELTLAPTASSVAKTDMTTHTPPADNANELDDAKNQQGSAINETTVGEIEQQQTSSEEMHEANESTNSGAELSQPGLQTSKGSHRDSIEARDTGSHHPEACASHELSSEIVSSQDDTALRPGGTARAVEEVPAHDYDRSGNEDKHQPSTDDSLQGQAEDLGNTLDAKHAVCAKSTCDVILLLTYSLGRRFRAAQRY